MRTFDGVDGIRDTANGKISYRGFRHPLCEQSFGKYMTRHRKCADGSMREPDNWWSIWDKKISLDSLTRHVVDLEALYAGLHVYKERYKDENGEDAEETIILPYTYEEIFKKELPENVYEIDEEDACGGIRFNTTAYLLKHLQTK